MKPKENPKIKKLEKEIESWQRMLDKASVPADEKAEAREEIAELREQIKKLEKAGDKKKKPAPAKKPAAGKKMSPEAEKKLADCREAIAKASGPRKEPVHHQAGTRLEDAVEKVWNIIEKEAAGDADKLKKGKELCQAFQKDIQHLLGITAGSNKDITMKANEAIDDADKK